jgi:hypothetical protein
VTNRYVEPYSFSIDSLMSLFPKNSCLEQMIFCPFISTAPYLLILFCKALCGTAVILDCRFTGYGF